MKHFLALILILAISIPALASKKDKDLKEWTLIIFLNGNNNLAPVTIKDLNEMEEVGSSDDVNVVVQWAHYDVNATKRLLVLKDDDKENVTSPTVMEMPRVDMGSWEVLVDFVRWSVENYPAKRYMVEVWNHGTGWHSLKSPNAGPTVNTTKGMAFDISSDDYTKNAINTPDLGKALRAAAEIMGQPVDLYGSDACAMASLEVVTELVGSTRFVVGSEELEEEDGWAYAGLLKKLVDKPKMGPAKLGKVIADTYFEANPDWSDLHGMTLSVIDLSKIDALNSELADFGQKLLAAGPDYLGMVWMGADMAQRFWLLPDYRDAGHFFENLHVIVKAFGGIPGIEDAKVLALEQRLKEVVVYNRVSPNYINTHGLTLWLPQFTPLFKKHQDYYSQLRFTQTTGWDKVLAGMVTELQ